MCVHPLGSRKIAFNIQIMINKTLKCHRPNNATPQQPQACLESDETSVCFNSLHPHFPLCPLSPLTLQGTCRLLSSSNHPLFLNSGAHSFSQWSKCSYGSGMPFSFFSLALCCQATANSSKLTFLLGGAISHV